MPTIRVPLLSGQVASHIEEQERWVESRVTRCGLKSILNVSNNNAKILINYMEKFKLLNQDINLDLATNVCTNISFFI